MTVQCFVIMPFGEKADAACNRVDFDVPYRPLLKPAIEGVGNVTPVRCDEIDMPGAIHSMMIGKIADCQLAVVDSLAHQVLDDVRCGQPDPDSRGQRQVIPRTEYYRYHIAGLSDRQIGIITGDLRNIDSVDIWVNSESTNMQMARVYERSVSGLIRYLGASKAFGTIREDTIALALEQALGGSTRVGQAAVVPTGPGELASSNRVKLLLHVTSVEGGLGVGYRPIAKIHWCVGNALREAHDPKYADLHLGSILFPVMDTGTGGGNLREMAEPQIREALRYLCATPDSSITRVWFSAFDESILADLRSVMDSRPELSPVDDRGALVW